VSAIKTNPGSAAALEPNESDRRARRMLRAAWWSFALLPFSFLGAAVLGGVILAAMGHDPDSQTDPSFWQMAVAGIPAVVVMILPCILVVWFGRRALAAGLEGGRDAKNAGLAVGAVLVAMNLVSVVLRLVAAVV
jgi:Na+/melibiose symporter-like transporter